METSKATQYATLCDASSPPDTIKVILTFKFRDSFLPYEVKVPISIKSLITASRRILAFQPVGYEVFQCQILK